MVEEMMKRYDTRDVLDYGCGKGTLSNALGFMVTEYDPCIDGKEYPKRPHDILVCTDVLEHIEPDCIDDVLSDIAASTIKAALLVISTRPAKKTLSDGRNAHLIVKDPSWWIAKISKLYDSVTKGETKQGDEVVLLCEVEK